MSSFRGEQYTLHNSESYQYDGNGNITQFTDRRGKVTTFTYDALNRRTFAGFGTQAGPIYESSITYNYDAGNRFTSVVDSALGTITPTFDNLDRLTSEVTPQGSVSYGYDAANRRTSQTVTGQTAINYAYDNGNRLTQITQGIPAVSFGYDNANRRTSLTLPNGIAMSYSYDGASQLTSINYQAGQISFANLTYGYDLASRRVSMGGSLARIGLPLPISITAYNANNQLTTWGSANLFHDANGNMTSDGTNSYTWNARNQLASMDFGAYSFQYDAYGRRVGKTISGSTTNYLYDGANVAQELSGTTPTANLLAGDIDEVFTRTDSSGTANFLTDALGSTLALADSSGNSLAQYSYEPFGNTTVTSGSSSNKFQYTGRENDGTGLYFYRARYYIPTLQRFISEDPVGLSGGTNEYAYTKDDPVNRVDASGQYDSTYHRSITSNALQDVGYDPARAAAMGNAVADVDTIWNQGNSAAETNVHAMAGRKPNSKKYQNCQQAYDGTVQSIADDIANANIPQALHTVQDATAAGHYGYQRWSGLASWTHAHYEGDASPDQSNVDNATQMTEKFMTDYWHDPDHMNPADYLPPVSTCQCQVQPGGGWGPFPALF